MNPTDERIENGLRIIENIWYDLAIKIVKRAIEIYKLDDEQAKELREVYLKPNNYQAELL